LPHLYEVTGALSNSGPSLTEVDLGGLEEAEHVEVNGKVGGFGSEAPGTLVRLELGSLRQTGSLALRGFATVETLSLPYLEIASDQVLLSGLGQMTTIHLPSLYQARSIQLEYGHGLRKVTLGDGHVAGLELLSLDHIDFAANAELVLPERIDGNVWLLDSNLTNLDLLYGLRDVETLHIHNNPELVSFYGLAQNLKVDGLYIVSNDALVDVDAPTGELTGDLVISQNEQLADLSGLAGITLVGGDLSIFSNDQLASLHGLEGIVHVGGRLEIIGGELTSLAPLAALAEVGGTITIDSNAVSDAEIDAFLARFQD
jgi:hypothetical protein